MSRQSGCGLGLIAAIVLLFAAGAIVVSWRSHGGPGTAVTPSAQLPPANP